jgi:O-antigen ligase
VPIPRPLRDPAVPAYGAVLALAGVQAATIGPSERVLLSAVPYVAALAVLVVVRALPRSAAAEAGPRAVAGAGCLLALWLLARFLGALPGGLGQEHGFYRVKLAVTSPLGDHNTAAGLLLVVLVAAAVATAADRRWSLALVLASAGMVATLSRGALVVLLVVTAASWVLAHRRRVAGVLTAAAVVVALGLTGASLVLDTSPPPPSTGTGGPLTEAGAGPLGVSILGRADLAVRGIELGREHPALGVGLGGFAEHAADLPRPNDHAHQALAHAAAEGGIVLLVVAAGLPVLLVVRAWRLPPVPVRDLVLLGGGALVAHAQLEILAGRVGYETLLAALLGLAAAAGPIDSRS